MQPFSPLMFNELPQLIFVHFYPKSFIAMLRNQIDNVYLNSKKSHGPNIDLEVLCQQSFVRMSDLKVRSFDFRLDK